MARGKIAPTLTRYMGPGVLLSEWDIGRKVAVAELRALLAVARAARREVRHAEWCLLWSGEPCNCRPKVDAALARLDRASGPKGGGR